MNKREILKQIKKDLKIRNLNMELQFNVKFNGCDIYTIFNKDGGMVFRNCIISEWFFKGEDYRDFKNNNKIEEEV